MTDDEADLPADLTGRLRIERPAQRWVDRWQRYRLFVDRTHVADIRRGGTVVVARAPGLHEVEARIDWTGAPPLLIDLADGEEVVLDVLNTRSAAEIGLTLGELMPDYLTLRRRD